MFADLTILQGQIDHRGSRSAMLTRLFARPGDTLALLAGYFLLQLILRQVVGGGLELDEAEQLILGQRLQVGYSAQPPLYTWLQIGVFQLFGHTLYALSLLKNLLLFATYLTVYFAARQVCPDARSAALASLSLLLIPEIGWESQRDLTHSVLATTLAAVTLWLVLGLAAGKDTWPRYLLLGLLLGLGILSKPNYLLFAVALLLALVSLERRLLLRPALLLTLGVAALVAGPYLIWLRDSIPVATASVHKFHAAGAWNPAATAEGLLSVVRAMLAFAGPLLVVYLLVFRRLPQRLIADAEPRQRRLRQLLLRTLWIVFAILVLLVLVSGAGQFKDRWLLPLLFFLPVVLFAAGPGGEGRARHYQAVLLALLLLIPAALAARVWLAPITGQYTKPHFPGELLAASVQQLVPDASLVIAENSLIAGNLKQHLPRVLVSFPPVDFPLRQLAGGGQVAVIWDLKNGPEMPQPLREYVRQQLGEQALTDREPTVIRAPYRLSEGEMVRLALVTLRPQQ
jgi:4-amino-4-deoxy-L-arabinose transferase-like glycosyltransferase